MTNESATPRLSRRGFAAMAGAAAMALTGHQIASAQQAGGQAAGSGPGFSLEGGTGITVTGNGRATSEVESGVLQFLVRLGPEAAASKGGAGGGEYYGGTDIPAPDEDALTNVVNALVEAGIPADQVLTWIGTGRERGRGRARCSCGRESRRNRARRHRSRARNRSLVRSGRRGVRHRRLR